MTDSNTTTDPWADAPINPAHAQRSLALPFIQWINGDPKLKKEHPALSAGGFGIPVEQFEAATADGVIPDHFTRGAFISDGKEIEAYLATTLRVAVLAQRFRWFKSTDQGGRKTEQHSAVYVEGYHGHVQVAVLVEGFNTALPLMLTYKGATVSRAFFDLQKAFRTEVLNAAAVQAKKPFPEYAFWLPIKAGPRTKPTQGSWVTPPVGVWDAAALKSSATRRDALVSLYVGNETLARAAALYDSMQTWAAVWPRAVRRTEAGQLEPTTDDDLPVESAE